MHGVRRNVLANFAGQAWASLIGVAFAPLYIRWMGLEAFGIVGFYLTIQAIASLFDLGLPGTLTRELARAGKGESDRVRDLLRTAESVYLPVGLLLGSVLALASPWIAGAWLHPVSLSAAQTSSALQWMALALVCQWPSYLYTAGLNGLQRQVLSNALSITFATLRGAGVLVPMLWIGPTLPTFFGWMAAVGSLQTLAGAIALWRAMPRGTQAPRPRLSHLLSVRSFLADLAGISVLTFLLMQSDRIILSRLVPLDRFGAYILASTTAIVLARAIQPWFAAIYPRLSQLHAAQDIAGLSSTYHRASQWGALTVLPLAAALIFHARPLLEIWTREPGLASQAAGPFAMFVAGYALNGVMTVPYALQLACGWSRLALQVNIVSVLLVIPSIFLLYNRFGLTGAASTWTFLNIGYVLVTIPLMHRRILRGEMMRWYRDVIALPLTACAAVWIAASFFPAVVPNLSGLPDIALTYLAFLAACALATPEPRAALLALARRIAS